MAKSKAWSDEKRSKYKRKRRALINKFNADSDGAWNEKTREKYKRARRKLINEFNGK